MLSRLLALPITLVMLNAPAHALAAVGGPEEGMSGWSLREPDAQLLSVQEQEAAVRAKVQDLLDKIYGRGRSTVRVTMEPVDAGPVGPKAKPQSNQVKRMHVVVEVQGLLASRVDDLTQIVIAVSGADMAGRGDRVIVRGVKLQEAPPKVLKDLFEVEGPSDEGGWAERLPSKH